MEGGRAGEGGGRGVRVKPGVEGGRFWAWGDGGAHAGGDAEVRLAPASDKSRVNNNISAPLPFHQPPGHHDSRAKTRLGPQPDSQQDHPRPTARRLP